MAPPGPDRRSRSCSYNLLSWNANGLSDHKLTLTHFFSRIAQYDVVAVQETGRATLPGGVLHHPYFAVEHVPGKGGAGSKGTGLFLLHHRRLRAEPWTETVEPAEPFTSTWIRVESAVTGLARPLLIGAVYIRPGHALLRDTWTALKRLVDTAKAVGHVVLMGDFNARLDTAAFAGRAARGGAPARPRAGGDQEPPAPPAPWTPGSGLIEMCAGSDMRWLTGAALGDMPPQPSRFPSVAGQQPSRIDHVLVDPPLVARVQRHSVEKQLKLSDHAGIITRVRMPQAPPPPPQRPPPSATALRWDGRRARAYTDALSELLPAIEADIDAACARGDPAAAAGLLVAGIRTAAATAGMAGGGGPWSGRPPDWARPARVPGRGFGQPWYDADCRAACAAVRAALRAAPRAPATRELRQQYRRLLRRKRAAYLHPQAAAALRTLLHDPRRFWRARGARPTALPATLDDPAKAADHFERAFAAPGTGGAGSALLPQWLDRAAGHRRWRPGEEAELNTPFDAEEVLKQLQRLRNGTSAGPAGLPPEFLRLARYADEDSGAFTYILPPVLTAIFNACITTGVVPDEWQLASITLLRKKPAPGAAPAAPSFDTVRPIAVGSVLPKLYARVLNARLVKWAEAHGKHAAEQAGFRPKMGTDDHLFNLNYVRDVVHGYNERPAYLAFIDLAKAYDSVQRDRLWMVLEYIGVRGPFLAAVQSLYADVRMTVQLPSGPSRPFACRRGVRQGCPLSPTLFTLFFDLLAGYLREDVLPTARQLKLDEGVPIGREHYEGRRAMRALFFADDVVLIARSRAGLQALVSRLELFCRQWALDVNLTKTQAMIVRPRGAAAPTEAPVLYRGKPLAWVDTYKYLGVTFHCTNGFEGGAVEAGARARTGLGRLSGYMGRHPELRKSLELRQRLFDTLALPGSEYGCIVWAFPWIYPSERSPVAGGCSPSPAPAEVAQVDFCRRLLNAPAWVASEILYRETGRAPLALRWVRAICRFWNKAISTQRRADTLTGWVMDACITRYTHHEPSWVGNLGGLLLELWPRPDEPVRREIEERQFIDGAQAAARLQSKFDETWRRVAALSDDPRDPLAPNRPHVTYYRWHWPERVMVEGRETYLHSPAVSHGTALRAAALRMGCCTALRVNAGRFLSGSQEDPDDSQRVPFEERLCLRCGTGAVDDSAHLLFECAAPSIAKVRERHAPFLATLPPVAEVGVAAACRAMAQAPDQAAMAEYAAACEGAARRAAKPRPPHPRARGRRRTRTGAPATATGRRAPRSQRGASAAAAAAAAGPPGPHSVAGAPDAAASTPVRRSTRRAAAAARDAIARLSWA